MRQFDYRIRQFNIEFANSMERGKDQGKSNKEILRRSHKMKKTIFTTIIIGLIAGLVVVTSCKKSSDTQNQPLVTGISIGNIASNFTEQDIQGNSLALEALKGKVIILTFSAMWCGPCRMEQPSLNSLYSQYKDQGLEIVQILYQDEDGTPCDPSDMQRWIDEFGMSFIVCSDPDYSTVNVWNFSGIPFNVVIDRDFVIRARITGYQPATIENEIIKHL